MLSASHCSVKCYLTTQVVKYVRLEGEIVNTTMVTESRINPIDQNQKPVMLECDQHTTVISQVCTHDFYYYYYQMLWLMDIYIQHLIQIARIYQPEYIHPTKHKNDSYLLTEYLLHIFTASKIHSDPRAHDLGAIVC